MYRWKTKNITKNQNVRKNYILRNIKQRKYQVPEKIQNSYKIKQKKTFWGVQIESKLPPVAAPKG